MKKQTGIKLLKRITMLFAVLVLCDRFIGWELKVLFYKQTHGDDYESIYLLEQTRENIVILGSSRALHSYNTEMIEKGVNMTCFNGGRVEMTDLYSSAALKVIYNRYSPKVVILDLLPTELFLSQGGKQKYERVASALMPFYSRHPVLKSTIDMAGNNMTLKMKLSHIYTYNSKLGSSIQNAYTQLGHIPIKGFEPLDGEIDSATYKEPFGGYLSHKNDMVDSNYLSALEEIINLTKSHGTRLIAFVSPYYFNMDFYNNPSYQALVELLQSHQCEFYDFSHDSDFLHAQSLFQDDSHLNYRGAARFTSSVIKLINKNTAGISNTNITKKQTEPCIPCLN